VIERFNFYDVYGYLLPGLAVLGLAWLPFGVISHSWPQNELLSAVVVLAFGYVLGHLLQNVATNAVPSTFRDNQRRQRRPSDLLLDKADTYFTDGIKQQIREKARAQFSVDLSVGADGDEQLSRSRNHVFLMARQMLIREQLVAYAEQFEGLYAMMRGLAIACLLGACYLFCWALAIFKYRCGWWLAALLLAMSLMLLGITGMLRNRRSLEDPKRYTIDKITLAGAAVAAGSAAYLLGFHRITDTSYSKVFSLLGVICLLLILRFYLAYRAFAFEFARVIWRHFAAQQPSTQT